MAGSERSVAGGAVAPASPASTAQTETQTPPSAGTPPIAEQPPEIYTKEPLELTATERAQYSQHRFDTTFAVPAAIVLSIVTFNFFFVFNYAFKHNKLPKIVRNDPSGGLAAGLLFVPFVNLYWVFFMWGRLVDRINFQFRLRNQPPPISRGLPVVMNLAFILSAITTQVDPNFGTLIWFLVWLILVPLFVGTLQSAINRLAGPV